MEIPNLHDVVIIFALSVFVLLVCHKLHIPALVGFFVTGIACGPHGFGFVSGIEKVDNMASIGIIFLLFTIGIEFSLKKLFEIKRFFFIGGVLQVALTSLIGLGVAQFLQRPLGESLFLGFLLSMSSTAIVLKALDLKDETDTLQGRFSLGILIFQDIVAVPMMILLPILSQESNGIDREFIYLLLKGCLVVAVVFVAALKIVPRLLYYIAKARSQELFLLTMLLICFSVTWLSSSVGLSLSIGAFLAGLIISESEYSREALSSIIPLRDIFASFFFVSMGMLLDLNFVLPQPFLIIGMAVAVILMKGAVVSLTGLALGMPLRILIIAGLALSQIGEFSFVLARSGIQYHLATDYHYQLFFSVALFTMVVSPSLIHFSGQIAKIFDQMNIPKALKNGFFRYPPNSEHSLKDHLIIIGFGINGRNLAKGAKDAGIPYIISEMNPQTVKTEQKKGEPIHYGDATHEGVLKHMGIERARSLAIVINDAQAARRIVELARRLNPEAYLLVRTRYILDRNMMVHLGANEVVADEFGSSVEILMRLLHHYQISKAKIDDCIHEVRLKSYQSPLMGEKR